MLSRTRAPLVAALLASAAPAHADSWLVLETPAAFAVSDAQEGLFKPGVMPAVGAYIGNAHGAVGLRLRAGMLANSAASADPYRDPGMGGLMSTGLAVRVPLPGHMWLEAVGGVGLTGHDVQPVVEAGVGWMAHVGGIEIGPSARIVRVVANATMDTLGTATIGTLGIDVRFGHPRRSPPPIYLSSLPVPEPEPEPVIPVVIDSDHDQIADHDASCATDLAACEFAQRLREEGASIQNDRIILEDRILFDLDRARVKHDGKRVIALVVEEWNRHPEWISIRIEGHTDERGTDEWNQELSDMRAHRVAAEFILGGIASRRLETVALGRSQPRATGRTEAAYRQNRRVELVVEREVTP